jgi:hypothetical protein
VFQTGHKRKPYQITTFDQRWFQNLLEKGVFRCFLIGAACWLRGRLFPGRVKSFALQYVYRAKLRCAEMSAANGRPNLDLCGTAGGASMFTYACS